MTTSNEHNNAPAVPQGWKLVPVEPTREMIKAMEGQWLIGSQADMAKREYSTMLATTPAPQVGQRSVCLTPPSTWGTANGKSAPVKTVDCLASHSGATAPAMWANPSRQSLARCR